MAFFTGAYATVWTIEDKGKYTKVILSTSRKNKETGQYETDFNDYVNFVGEAHRLAQTLKPRDRIRLGDVNCSNWYNKEKNRKYYNFTAFTYEPVSSYNPETGVVTPATANNTSAAPAAADDDPF
jgi:hypothetical protein